MVGETFSVCAYISVFSALDYGRLYRLNISDSLLVSIYNSVLLTSTPTISEKHKYWFKPSKDLSKAFENGYIH